MWRCGRMVKSVEVWTDGEECGGVGMGYKKEVG